MSRNGHHCPCDLLAARNRPEGAAAGSRVPQAATRLRFIHLGIVFFAVSFAVFLVAFFMRKSVRAGETVEPVFFLLPRQS